MGRIFFVRPSAGIEYYRLSEDGYQEGRRRSALDLAVDKRKSDELAVNGLLIAGFEWGGYRSGRGLFPLRSRGRTASDRGRIAR